MLALADANNFFVSAERAFNPKLEGKPVIILSSNDGCAVSRSAEAKALGIPMGAPWFQLKHQARFKEVIALSSNFELYGEVSARMMRVLANHSTRHEVASIDECFLDLAHIPAEELVAYAQSIRDQVLQWIGVPLSIGLAPTKTLAKLAAERAKKQGSGVWLLPDVLQDGAADMGVGEVWGIGPASARKLQDANIRSVRDLVQLSLPQAQKMGGATLAKTVAEVQGRSCIELHTQQRDPKQIMSSRSFGKLVKELPTVQAAVRSFTDKCAGRLRKYHVAAQSIMVYLVARLPDGSRSTLSKGHQFTQHVEDPELLQAVTAKLAAELFRPGLAYVKAGVLLVDLQTTSMLQSSLFEDATTDAHAQRAATAARINALTGSELTPEALEQSNRVLAIAGVAPGSALLEDWKPRAGTRTPAYTSNWQELPVAKTG